MQAVSPRACQCVEIIVMKRDQIKNRKSAASREKENQENGSQVKNML